jgi:protein tyrosine phosphatase
MGLFNRIALHYSHNRPVAHVHFDALTALDYNYIDDGIYMGTNQCCTAGLSEVLKKEGITSDISLEEDRLDEPRGVSQYIWIPTANHGVPTADQLSFAIQTLEYLVKTKQKVYLHCKNGHGRSSTYISAYLIKTRGYTQEQALDFIKKHRPTAHMQDVQVQYVKEFEKSLSGKV